MRRAATVGAILALALLPSLYFLSRSLDVPTLGFFHDDAFYLLSGKSLAEDNGYRALSLPGQPYQTKYPPLFPLILSAAWRWAPAYPANLPVAVALTWLPLPLILSLCYFLFREYGSSARTALALTAVFALSPWWTYFSTTLLAETWLTLFVLAAVLTCEQAQRREETLWAPALAGVWAACAFLTRTAALPMLVTTPLVFLLGRRIRSAAAFTGALLPAVAAWSMWSAAHRKPGTDWVSLYYLDYVGYYLQDVSLQDLPLFIYRNVDSILTSIGDMMLFQMSDLFMGRQLAWLIAIGSIMGCIRIARRRAHLHYPFFAAGQIALLLIWNFPANPRLLLALFPVFYYGLWIELVHIAAIIQAAAKHREASQRAAARIAWAVLGIFLCGAVWINLDGWRQMELAAQGHRDFRAQMRPAYQWISDHVPAGSAFYADRDPMLYLNSGSPGCMAPIPSTHFYRGDNQRILSQFHNFHRFVQQQGLGYILLTSRDFERDPIPGQLRRVLREDIAADASFQPVFETASASIFRVEPPETKHARR
ncbi:MAG: hypothetical protein JJE04_21470 [Acidobacteriia bacterium]|nr:hypothetical protein [Terriglobia bacterium]